MKIGGLDLNSYVQRLNQGQMTRLKHSGQGDQAHYLVKNANKVAMNGPVSRPYDFDVTLNNAAKRKVNII